MSKTGPQPTPDELTLKQWIAENARKAGVSIRCQWSRMYRGKIDPPQVSRRINARVIFVKLSP